MEENKTHGNNGRHGKKLVLDLDGYLDKVGITQHAVTQMTGLSATTVSNMARGSSMIKLSSLTKLCQALNLDPSDLIVWVPNERK